MKRAEPEMDLLGVTHTRKILFTSQKVIDCLEDFSELDYDR